MFKSLTSAPVSGLTYERQFKFEGERLRLTATPFTFNGARRFNRLVWQHVKAV